jgi:hypothetical protein
VLGAAVGLGFAAFESAGYAFNALFTSSGLSLADLVETEVLRGILAPVGHGLWTAILGGVLFAAAARHGRLRLTSIPGMRLEAVSAWRPAVRLGVSAGARRVLSCSRSCLNWFSGTISAAVTKRFMASPARTVTSSAWHSHQLLIQSYHHHVTFSDMS